MGECCVWLPERTKAMDFTWRGLVTELAERGLKVDYRAVWNFLHAEKLNFKKTVVASERHRDPTSRTDGRNGTSIKSASSLSVWSS